MLSRAELLKLARARLEDARSLETAGRYNAAFYICGYAIECARKARIVATLKWSGVPDSRREFEHLASFKTHDLQTLLQLAGREDRVKSSCLLEWTEVIK